MAEPAFSIKLETAKFNRHIQKMIRKYPEKTNVVLKKFAFDLLGRIIANTEEYRHPVLTGRARAGWYASARGLGVPWSDMGDDYQGAISEGKAEGSYREQLSGLKRYIDLINGLKYIMLLEYGSSLQAPYGMVRLNMRKMAGDKLPNELGKELQKEWKRF